MTLNNSDIKHEYIPSEKEDWDLDRRNIPKNVVILTKDGIWKKGEGNKEYKDLPIKLKNSDIEDIKTKTSKITTFNSGDIESIVFSKLNSNLALDKTNIPISRLQQAKNVNPDDSSEIFVVTKPSISGPTQEGYSKPVTLSASGSLTAFSENNVSIDKYEWLLPNGETREGNTIIYVLPGLEQADQTITIKCRAIDEIGNPSDYSEHSIFVLGNTPPVIDSISWSSGILYDNESYDLTIQAHDEEGNTLSYNVTCNDNNVSIIQDNTNKNIFHITFPEYTQDTNLTFTISVSDGLTTTTTQEVKTINNKDILGVKISGSYAITLFDSVVDSNGNCYAISSYNGKSLLVKIDINGNVEYKFFRDSVGSCTFKKITIDSNDRIFIIGSEPYNSTINSCTLLKIDSSNLSILDKKRYLVDDIDNVAVFDDILIDNSDNIIIVGRVITIGNVFFIIKFLNTGLVLDTYKMYQNDTYILGDIEFKLTQDISGNFYIVSRRCEIITLDNLFNITNMKKINFDTCIHAVSDCQIDDSGNFYINGYSIDHPNDAIIIKTNTSFNVLTFKRLTCSNYAYNTRFYGLSMNNSNIINVGIDTGRGIIIQYGNTLNIDYSKSIGANNGLTDVMRTVSINNGGTIFILGRISSSGYVLIYRSEIPSGSFTNSLNCNLDDLNVIDDINISGQIDNISGSFTTYTLRNYTGNSSIIEDTIETINVVKDNY
jgi:hypothetical protein